jgi:putative transposase
MRRLSTLFSSEFLEEHAEESHAQLILHELGEFLGYSPPPLLDRLIEDAQKIHKQRPILQETPVTATRPKCEA